MTAMEEPGAASMTMNRVRIPEIQAWRKAVKRE